MNKEIGLLVVEGEDGQVSIQLFDDVDKSHEMFSNLKGKPAEKPYRTTFVGLKYKDEGLETISEAKILPIIDSAEDVPDGFIIGQGPVDFEGEEK